MFVCVRSFVPSFGLSFFRSFVRLYFPIACINTQPSGILSVQGTYAKLKCISVNGGKLPEWAGVSYKWAECGTPFFVMTPMAMMGMNMIATTMM